MRFVVHDSKRSCRAFLLLVIIDNDDDKDDAQSNLTSPDLT